MRQSVVIKRLEYEASAGWTTYGTSLAAFSWFQGIAALYEGSSEKWFVVPPSGRKLLASRNGSATEACGLKAGLRTALFILFGRSDAT